MLTFRHRDVATKLGELRVRTVGEGPALLFWSSLLMSGDMWLAQARHFSKSYQVILVDPPGHGESEALHRGFEFSECALCVVQVLDALDIRKTHYVGNSWGGMIGGTFAALFPERVGAAVLMNCTASAVGWKQRLEYEFLCRLIRTVGYVPAPLHRIAIRAFAGPTTERERPQAIADMRKALEKVDGESVHWAIQSVVPRRPDQHATMRAIRTPVLVVAGEEDRTFPVAETRAMAESIRGAKFIVMPRTAHLAGLECPDEVNQIVGDFLKLHP